MLSCELLHLLDSLQGLRWGPDLLVEPGDDLRSHPAARVRHHLPFPIELECGVACHTLRIQETLLLCPIHLAKLDETISLLQQLPRLHKLRSQSLAMAAPSDHPQGGHRATNPLQPTFLIFSVF